MLPLLVSVMIGFESGNSLLTVCQGEVPQQLTCMGYVAGIADALSASASMSNNSERRFCRPQDGTVGQLKDVAVQYLVAHPETRNLSAGYLVSIALLDAFHCDS